MTESGRIRVLRFNNSLKTAKQPNNIFRGLNIRYFGPVDGHDVVNLVRILTEIKKHKGPKVLHALTIKGKGYAPAEHSATIWHAPGEFDVKTGERLIYTQEGQPPLYQEVFGETLLELAKQNKNIVGITPAMPSGCSMNIMQKEMPDRVFDVGIAEGHAVTFAAGLAKAGAIPFCNIYSAFLQRSYDNIIHDVAILNLPVVLCIDRAGIVGADGQTHHGLFDMAYLRPIPNLTIMAPMNETELRNMMYTAQNKPQGAVAIRYPRGRGVVPNWRKDFEEIAIGKGRLISGDKDAKYAVLSIGHIGNAAHEAIKQLGRDDIAHYDMRFLKPIDKEIIERVGKQCKVVFTIEDGVISGGLGSAVLETLADMQLYPKVVRIGIDNQFIEHGSTKELYALLGMDAEGIAKKIADNLNN